MPIDLFIDLSADNNFSFVVIVNVTVMTDVLFKSYYSCYWKNEITLYLLPSKKVEYENGCTIG